MRLRKTRRTLEGNPSGLQPESVATAAANGSHTLHCRGCLSLLAPDRPLQHVELDFFSNAESGVVEMAMLGQYTTTTVTALEGQTEKSRGQTCLGLDLKGEASKQGKTRELHRRVRTTCTT